MSGKQDRRSQRTRQLLGEALIELIREKGYSTITVKDIIDRANVGRSTFYAHYHDKDDLLALQLDHMIEILSQDIPQEAQEENLFFSSLGLFRHVGEYYELYKALGWGSETNLFFKNVQKSISRRFEQHLRESGREIDIPIPILATFIAGSFVALLKWWLENKMVYSPEQMDEIFKKLTVPGVKAQAIKP